MQQQLHIRRRIFFRVYDRKLALLQETKEERRAHAERHSVNDRPESKSAEIRLSAKMSGSHSRII